MGAQLNTTRLHQRMQNGAQSKETKNGHDDRKPTGVTSEKAYELRRTSEENQEKQRYAK